MALARSEVSAQAAEVARLRAQIGSMQRRTAVVDALPVHDPLAPLFPEGGLRPGSSYALPDSASLLLALIGAASRDGSWCAVIGMPHLSAEAAEGYGVDPARLALIPRPAERWRQAVATASEVFPLVAVRPSSPAAPAEAARIDARLRENGSCLLAVGSWPGASASLAMAAPEWQGLGRGHGLLSSRAVTIQATGRRAPRPRSVRVLLPGASGGVESATPRRVDGRAHLRAVPA